MRAIGVTLVTMMIVASAHGQGTGNRYLATGLFIGSIEEGARIFTPARLLPYEHPEAKGHDFPTVLQLHKGEAEALLILGNRVGFKLWPTLQRYPMEPDTLWPYEPFAPPPVEEIGIAPVTILPDSLAPLPGLLGVTYVDREPVSFIVDTRGLTLEERGMDRATSMGLDISRAEFRAALADAAAHVPQAGTAVLVFKSKQP